MGLNAEFRGHVESMCSGGLLGLLTRTQDEVCDFFENLTWDNYEFEQAKATIGYTIHESAFHVNPYHRDHFGNSYDPSPAYMPPTLCDYYESSDHDAYSCICRAYVDAKHASMEKRLNEID